MSSLCQASTISKVKNLFGFGFVFIPHLIGFCLVLLLQCLGVFQLLLVYSVAEHQSQQLILRCFGLDTARTLGQQLILRLLLTQQGHHIRS